LKDTPVLVKEAMSTRKPALARNVQTDPRAADSEYFRRQRIVSYLGIPLVVKKRVLGVLVFLTREDHLFTNEEIEFFTTLAGEAAIAIDNSQLYEQSRIQAVELEKSNAAKDEFLEVLARQKEELSRLNAGLECEIAERAGAVELATKNRDLETLLYVTSHDLREPLRAIENFCDCQRTIPGSPR
jgi:GAF domain-containing protein